jgi:hypothetical protein
MKQHTNDIAVSLVSEGETKNMAEFLCTGNDDDTLYTYLKMCVMHLLAISIEIKAALSKYGLNLDHPVALVTDIENTMTLLGKIIKGMLYHDFRIG